VEDWSKTQSMPTNGVWREANRWLPMQSNTTTKIGGRSIVKFWKLSSKKACFAPQVFNQSAQKNHPKVVFLFFADLL
jgi:hypothetical protein